jgi:uncharacterized protein YeaO (DUF488 family)
MPSKSKTANVKIKRVYEPSKASDGTRILVDRLWPRGLSKRKAAIDEWIREVAPSTTLRKWFGHDPERWPQFRTRYRAELKRNPAALKRLRALARERRPVTLVYAAHDEAHNNAVVLKSLLRR